jgi:hypothetical protein
VRQFLSPRFWLSLGAVAGLFLLLVAVFGRGDSTSGAEASGGESPTAELRHLDLVSWVYLATPAPGFAFDDGVTTSDLALQLDGTRTMVIKAGTPGEIDCPTLTQVAQCTVAADLLGDAVLWFSIIPGPPGPVLALPAIREVLDSPWVQLANGWVVRRASRVERSCPEDTSSLTDFIRTHGDAASSTFNVEQQEVVRVTCQPADGTTTTVATQGTVTGTSVIIGTEEDGTGESGDSVLPSTTVLPGP